MSAEFNAMCLDWRDECSRNQLLNKIHALLRKIHTARSCKVILAESMAKNYVKLIEHDGQLGLFRESNELIRKEPEFKDWLSDFAVAGRDLVDEINRNPYGKARPIDYSRASLLLDGRESKEISFRLGNDHWFKPKSPRLRS